jgi:hypothetical protein
MRPVLSSAKVRQDIELNAHFVRLNLWELYFGAARVALATLAALPGPDRFPSGKHFFEGEIRNAF